MIILAGMSLSDFSLRPVANSQQDSEMTKTGDGAPLVMLLQMLEQLGELVGTLAPALVEAHVLMALAVGTRSSAGRGRCSGFCRRDPRR